MLIEALGLERSRLTALCGAGGKTTLMFTLAREFVAAGERVLITTTTKIAKDETYGWHACAAATRDQILEHARRLVTEHGPERSGAVIAYSAEGADGHRLVGFAPDLVDELAETSRFDRILVEADGSARKPLKAPAAHEPVIPSATDALVIVAGINGLGLPLNENHLFRAEIWSKLSGLALGAPITAESLALCVAHSEGLARGCPAGARQALFLNQVNTPGRHAAAKQAIEILALAPSRRVARVVVGCLLPQPNVVEIASL